MDRKFKGSFCFFIAYLFLNAAFFAGMAVIGWMSFGMKPGMHKVAGFAMDARGNVISGLIAVAALVLAVFPDRQSDAPAFIDEGIKMVEAGLVD